MRRATGAAADVLERAVPVVLAGWFIASVLAQHPDRSYDRIRKADKTGSGIAIPNWRFFAPNPSVEDQHFLYRLANEDKSEHTEHQRIRPPPHHAGARIPVLPGAVGALLGLRPQ